MCRKLHTVESYALEVSPQTQLNSGVSNRKKGEKMIIEIEIPDTLPEGHGASFKKGVAEVLLKNATTALDDTPNGHERSRERGKLTGAILAAKIASVVKPVRSEKKEKL